MNRLNKTGRKILMGEKKVRFTEGNRGNRVEEEASVMNKRQRRD